jgi:hypothetical protein
MFVAWGILCGQSVYTADDRIADYRGRRPIRLIIVIAVTIAAE